MTTGDNDGVCEETGEGDEDEGGGEEPEGPGEGLNETFDEDEDRRDADLIEEEEDERDADIMEEEEEEETKKEGEGEEETAEHKGDRMTAVVSLSCRMLKDCVIADMFLQHLDTELDEEDVKNITSGDRTKTAVTV